MNCYVLTGGRSRRMGRPKHAIRLGDRTFLDRVVAAAREAFDRVVAVERPAGAGHEGLETIREDGHEEEGPIFGLAAALRHASGRCFVLAVDYPLVTPGFLTSFRRRFERSAAPVVVPVHCGIPQPLCAGYSPAVLPLVEERIRSKQYGLRSLLPEAELVPSEGPELLNVNTPEQLQEAEREYERQRLLTSR